MEIIIARRIKMRTNQNNIKVARDYLRLENIICTGSDGKIFEQYPALYVAKDVERNRAKKHVVFETYEAISHFEKHARQLPDFPTLCGILEYVFTTGVRKRYVGTYGYDYTYEVLDADAKAILDQFKNHGAGYGWQGANTIVDGVRGRIIHHPYDSDFRLIRGGYKVNTKLERIVKPFKRRSRSWIPVNLKNALKDSYKANFLRDLTGRNDLTIFLELADYFNSTAIFDSLLDNQRNCSVSLGCSGDGFFHIASGGLTNLVLAFRGVRRASSAEKSAGARKIVCGDK